MDKIWNKYYTPTEVARFMVDLIDVQSPKSVIDICVGSWNLLREARNKWDNVKLYGVDIDNHSSISSLPKSRFYQMDGRCFAINCFNNQERFSIVLANPPFGKLKKADLKLYVKLPGYEEMSKEALNRIETTMLLANLSLIDEGGFMAAIVPSTAIDGEWSNCLRIFIAKSFRVHYIINLPHIFGRDISTSIMVLEKSIPSHQLNTQIINLKVINGKLIFDILTTLSLKQIIVGEWTFPSTRVGKNLKDINIIRGEANSSNLLKTGVSPIIHSTDIKNIKNNNWSPTRFSENSFRGNSEKFTKKGDILIVRVGRNCGLSAFVTEPLNLPVSDCVFILRSISVKIQMILWRIVNSSKFNQDIRKLRKGVSTFYLTKSILYNYLQAEISNLGGDS